MSDDVKPATDEELRWCNNRSIYAGHELVTVTNKFVAALAKRIEISEARVDKLTEEIKNAINCREGYCHCGACDYIRHILEEK